VRQAVVYFIQAGETGPIKIGFTSGCPLDRMGMAPLDVPPTTKRASGAS
jgi:hypothetical protein